MSPGTLEEDEGPAPDLRVLVYYGILRSRAWILLLTTLGTLVGLLVALAQPNVYTSTATLQFVPGVAETSTALDMLGFEDDVKSVPGIEDEIMLLSDPRVMRTVAIELTPAWILATPDPTREDGDHTPLPVRLMHGLQNSLLGSRDAAESEPIRNDSEKAIQGATDALLGRVRLSTGRRSQIIVVEADAWTPLDAQRTLTQVVNAFIRKHNEHYRTNLGSLESELTVVNENLLLAREADRSHKAECGFADLEQVVGATQDRIQDLRSKLPMLRARENATVHKLDRWGEQIAKLPEEITVTEPDRMIRNPRIGVLESEIKREEEYIELITVREPIRDPIDRQGKVEAARQKITRLREQLSGEQALVSEYPDGNPPSRTERNPDRVELQASIDEAEIDLAACRIEMDEVDSEVKELQQLMARAEACRSVHRDSDEKISGLLQRTSKLEGRIDIARGIQESRQEGESNLRVYTPADFDPERSAPRRSRIVGLAFGAGAALGCLLALLRQILERRVRYKETLEKALGIPVLAVIDEHKSLRKLRPEATR